MNYCSNVYIYYSGVSIDRMTVPIALVYDYANILDFHWPLEIEQNNPRDSLRIFKKIDVDFHPTFHTNKLFISKTYTNKVYVKLNCVLNNVKISL
jgi:hypothetical protein